MTTCEHTLEELSGPPTDICVGCHQIIQWSEERLFLPSSDWIHPTWIHGTLVLTIESMEGIIPKGGFLRCCACDQAIVEKQSFVVVPATMELRHSPCPQ